MNSGDIGNAFRDYYISLYNLRDDSATWRLITEIIKNFLDSIFVPKLNQIDLHALNKPFSETELLKTITSTNLQALTGSLQNTIVPIKTS